MMQLPALVEHLQTLEGVRESRQRGLLRWTVGGRLVARQLDEDAVVIRTDFRERERLIAERPETFTLRPRFEAHMMVVVELADASPAAVYGALDAAYALQTGQSR